MMNVFITEWSPEFSGPSQFVAHASFARRRKKQMKCHTRRKHITPTLNHGWHLDTADKSHVISIKGKYQQNVQASRLLIWNMNLFLGDHDGWWFVCCSKMWRNKIKQRFSEMHFVAQQLQQSWSSCKSQLVFIHPRSRNKKVKLSLSDTTTKNRTSG